MAENRTQNLPQPSSLDELVEFFDTHDMGDYLEKMPEVEFSVDLNSKRHLVALDEEVSSRLMEIAKTRQVSTEALVNAWLKERMSMDWEDQKGAS